jgi:hypothetical protein
MAICRLEHAAQLWKGGTEGAEPKAGRSLFLMRNLLRLESQWKAGAEHSNSIMGARQNGISFHFSLAINN